MKIIHLRGVPGLCLYSVIQVEIFWNIIPEKLGNLHGGRKRHSSARIVECYQFPPKPCIVANTMDLRGNKKLDAWHPDDFKDFSFIRQILSFIFKQEYPGIPFHISRENHIVDIRGRKIHTRFETVSETNCWNENGNMMLVITKCSMKFYKEGTWCLFPWLPTQHHLLFQFIHSTDFLKALVCTILECTMGESVVSAHRKLKTGEYFNYFSI